LIRSSSNSDSGKIFDNSSVSHLASKIVLTGCIPKIRADVFTFERNRKIFKGRRSTEEEEEGRAY